MVDTGDEVPIHDTVIGQDFLYQEAYERQLFLMGRRHWTNNIITLYVCNLAFI